MDLNNKLLAWPYGKYLLHFYCIKLCVFVWQLRNLPSGNLQWKKIKGMQAHRFLFVLRYQQPYGRWIWYRLLRKKGLRLLMDCLITIMKFKTPSFLAPLVLSSRGNFSWLTNNHWRKTILGWFPNHLFLVLSCSVVVKVQPLQLRGSWEGSWLWFRLERQH